MPRAGLTSACLGLVHALDRLGQRVAYVKPIGQRGDVSPALLRLATGLVTPDPLPPAEIERLLSSGDDQLLLEQVVRQCEEAGRNADVLVVEGLVGEPGAVYAARVNALMQRALDAELVLVASHVRDQTPQALADAVAIAARGYGVLGDGRKPGCLVNRVSPAPDAAGEAQWRAALAHEGLRALAIVPWQADLAAPRVKDVTAALGASVLRVGDGGSRRIRDFVLCAMTVPNALKALTPGALVITPGDRSDIILATALAVLGGLPLAGLLLTGGLPPDPGVLALCDRALSTGLPVLLVQDGSFAAAARVAGLDAGMRPDDSERADAAMHAIADRLDADWLRTLAASGREPRLSPPAFRHHLVAAARAAALRILLPEGDEPRTIAAAVIAAARGIARPVLLGDPAAIAAAAAKAGLDLSAGVEVIDAAAVSERYVDALVAARRHKGMTADMARSELADPIMVGTMMLHLGEADGLVSGAVHTTAHTIRPALQIIKTAPGASLVSSIFFMCLPDQVLVFGDCAVNPTPNAEQLADIAIQSADSAAAFGITPRVAMLSYSTGASGSGEDVEKVRRATALARALRPDLAIDGPLQYDAAVMPDVARSKAPGSPVAGRATVLIFPDLNTGNVTYKAVQRSAGVISMGPMLQGLAKPVNDLSRGCLVDDIVFTIALTAVQAAQARARTAGMTAKQQSG